MPGGGHWGCRAGGLPLPTRLLSASPEPHAVPVKLVASSSRPVFAEEIDLTFPRSAPDGQARGLVPTAWLDPTRAAIKNTTDGVA